MSGHTVGRKRTWPWAVLSVLFGLTVAWSFALMGEQAGGVWSVLRIGSAVGLGLCLLRLVVVSISPRRGRHAQEQDGRRAEGDEGAEAQPSDEQPPTEERARTYEEVFGPEVDLDAEGLPSASQNGDMAEAAGSEIDSDGQPSAEPAAPEWDSASEDDVEPPHADVDEHVDHVDALDADDGSEEHLRRIREEFRARAEEAALRVKQREAELEAASVADQER
jgi:hypothetical protein